jgi:hypothetical protein
MSSGSSRINQDSTSLPNDDVLLFAVTLTPAACSRARSGGPARVSGICVV